MYESPDLSESRGTYNFPFESRTIRVDRTSASCLRLRKRIPGARRQPAGRRTAQHLAARGGPGGRLPHPTGRGTRRFTLWQRDLAAGGFTRGAKTTDPGNWGSDRLASGQDHPGAHRHAALRQPETARLALLDAGISRRVEGSAGQNQGYTREGRAQAKEAGETSSLRRAPEKERRRWARRCN